MKAASYIEYIEDRFNGDMVVPEAWQIQGKHHSISTSISTKSYMFDTNARRLRFDGLGYVRNGGGVQLRMAVASQLSR